MKDVIDTFKKYAMPLLRGIVVSSLRRLELWIMRSNPARV
jgi:hypothetical protein